jgi:hypothetical protein
LTFDAQSGKIPNKRSRRFPKSLPGTSAMRFLHTADWQIGMKAAHVGPVGARVRQQRLQTAQRVLELACEHQAEFLLLAGDTFEDNGVDRLLVQKIADTLARFPGPVFLLPGNHDPLVPGSVWEHPAWAAHANLVVVRDAAPIPVPGGMLHPCPLREKHGRRDPTRSIEAQTETSIAVGMAHGTVEGVSQDEMDFPIARDAAARAGVDYLALGHWHSVATYGDSAGAMRMAYSGTHETTKFGERASGHVLLVNIPERGAPPQVEQLASGGLAWRSVVAELAQPGDLTRLRESLEAMTDGDRTLVELRLGGVLWPDEQCELERIGQLVASRFVYARMDRSGLRPPPDDDGWIAGLPPGPMVDAARRLQGWADPSSSTRPEGVTAEVASAALLKLYSLAAEAST